MLLSLPDAPAMFASLRHVIVDEIHAPADSKRGDLLSLGLSRLQSLAPGLLRIACPPPSPTALPSRNGSYPPAAGRMTCAWCLAGEG